MAFDEWDKDEQGRLKVWPLQGFTTALFGGEVGALRLEVGKPRPGLPSPAVQVSANPEQLRALAEALTEVADHLERGTVPSSPPPLRTTN
ncbi:hypothetical protein GCM10007301_04200 [Azorhizobium oxalatiphilum]|uniref:Uncharacterized protein n=1 Tax=Azorhizobium oxalatiphilum TaxID=980631 RepID=A0A917F4R8_9HYPH|nr:hypothetical protein [Azorhizobium oxalatiphilum]GGF48060.1 hypothetical protein GCM10007301_04200 [Azorhizobium oxalatiphilum]